MKKRILIYGIGTFFSKILVFLMVPVYTRVFSTSDFGYYDVLISDMQMIVSISFVEIWSGIIRFMFEDENRYRPIKTMLRMTPVLMMFYAAGVFILSFFFEIKYPVVTVIYGIMYLMFSVSNSICRGLEHNTKYVISGLISTFVSCTLSIVFAVFLHLGIQYLLVAQSVGCALAVGYVELTTKSYSKAVHSTYIKGSIKEMSKYCIPLMMNSFSFLFLGTYNKNIIISKLGEDLSGIYAYVGKFSAIVAVLLSVYALAWQEQAFVSANADNSDEQYSHYLNEFIKLIGLGIPVYIMACIIFSPLFGGRKYYNSEIYIPLAILGGYVSNFSGIISTVIAVKKKTVFILYSTAVGALLNVLIATLTIRNYGINASALSLCISFGVTAMLRYYFAKKDFDLKLKWGYFGIMTAETAIILIGLYTIGSRMSIDLLALAVVLIIWLLINWNSIKTVVASTKNMIRR